MPKLSSRARLIVVGAAPLLTFLALELGLRAGGFAYAPRTIALSVWNAERDAAMAAEQDLHRIDPVLLWAPEPGRAVVPGGAELVNADGFRGALVPQARTPGVLRVALLGESATFGLELPLEDTAAVQLERLCAEQGLAVEVLNAAVIGHTAWQGLARWREHVRRFSPDLVFAAFGSANEHHPCKVLPDEEKLAALEASAGSGLAAPPCFIRWCKAASSPTSRRSRI